MHLKKCDRVTKALFDRANFITSIQKAPNFETVLDRARALAYKEIKAIPAAVMKTLLVAADGCHAEVAQGLMSAWSNRIHVAADRLNSKVPNYKPYVETSWDEEKVRNCSA